MLIQLLMDRVHRRQFSEMATIGTSLVAQWISLRTSNAGGLGLSPCQGTRSHMHAATKSSHAITKEPAFSN